MDETSPGFWADRPPSPAQIMDETLPFSRERSRRREHVHGSIPTPGLGHGPERTAHIDSKQGRCGGVAHPAKQ